MHEELECDFILMLEQAMVYGIVDVIGGRPPRQIPVADTASLPAQ